MPTTLEQLQYGFDRDSRRTWRQRATTQGWDNTYVYDSLSQVIGDDLGDLNLARNAIAGIPNNGSRWQYDETGNWHGYETLADGAATLSQSRTHDKGNRLMEVTEAAAMRTDRAGRMLETVPGPDNNWNSSFQITWDAWSRIVGVASVEGGTVIPVAVYGYDGIARRITRYIDEQDVTLHSYYNGEWRSVEERKDSETTAAMSYLWGSRHRDDLVRRDRAVGGTTLNETRYILMDYFSPAALTDETGAVTERYQFSAFGLRTILNPDYTVRNDSECGMEFSFQGQFVDVKTGWLNYGYRYYLPSLGRWPSRDPIREVGGSNLYAASNNNPAISADQFGLDPVKYDFDKSSCTLRVTVTLKLSFIGQAKSSEAQAYWKTTAKKQADKYFDNLPKKCTPSSEKCCICKDGVKIDLNLRYKTSALLFWVDAIKTKVHDDASYRSSADIPHVTGGKKADLDWADTEEQKGQIPLIHEMGHMLGLQHPEYPGTKLRGYDADPNSLMGYGMEMRDDDFDTAFCSHIDTGDKNCDPWGAN